MQQDFFHSNLRRAREEAGLSQTELAEELGIARTTIVSLESGKTRLFNKNLQLVADHLHRSVEELLCGASADVLLMDEPSRQERERALKADYEGRIALLQDKLEAATRLNEALQANVDSLTRSNQYLIEQLRKEQ
ncbi:MAG: helix-turn-helix transcriptional regulator [Bacteroidales bacterium]|nr:helix-turn-helix transcriptional regulator [Bacteroidales bacterium]